MAAQPLGTLLGDTWSFSLKHWKPLLVGAVVFGVIMGVMQVNLRSSVASQMGNMMQGVGSNAGNMQEIMERMQAGDQEAAEEFAKNMAGMNEDDVRRIGAGALGNLLPTMGYSVLLSILVGVLSMTYFFLVALWPERSPAQTFSAMPGVLLPMIGLSVWTFLRSFTWIPVIGFVFALYYYPRFIVAPLSVLEQKKGVLDSTKASIDATKFYWGKIVGNVIVLGIILAVVSVVIGMVVGMILGSSSVGAIVVAIIQQALAGGGTVFAVKLARTIQQNPVHA